MPRWKELPTELDPRVRQLAVRLRRLKDHSGLTMRQLAAKTGYSAKSWERYLGGRTLPPPEAVEALARIGGDDPTRLLALHEIAADAWGGRRGATSVTKATHATTGTAEAAEATVAVQVPESPPAGTKKTRRRVRSPRVALVAGAVTLVVALSAAVLVVVRPPDGVSRAAAAPVAPSAAASPSPSKPTYTCRMERIDGHWYAGNSRTQDALLADGFAGPKVAEAQCLLRRAGISPGKIDGIYGPLTQRAVQIVQKRAGLPKDGLVGPHTWKALRVGPHAWKAPQR
ncbi:peptidoglycan-binding protein [Streptomyces sp. CA-288835]|uniref:peptidoglycan-binding protein n=1 Tax=Streptomyces sp. CA-288835 TaxID=3240069 RepID=UPI003D8CD021